MAYQKIFIFGLMLAISLGLETSLLGKVDPNRSTPTYKGVIVSYNVTVSQTCMYYTLLVGHNPLPCIPQPAVELYRNPEHMDICSTTNETQ